MSSDESADTTPMVDPEVERIVTALANGEVVIIPTDTVYGLAADPRSEEAMNRLFELKQRPDGVPVAVLVGSIGQARELITVSPEFVELAAGHWPGALTLVAERTTDNSVAPLHLGDVDTVGVRMPDHDLIRSCALAFGPIAATSANRHGEPTITDPVELDRAFGDDVSLIVDGGELGGLASTVVDLTVVPPKVLRQGVVLLDHVN